MHPLDIQGATLPPLRGLPPGARALVVEDRTHPDQSDQPRNLLRPSLQSLGLEVFYAPGTERAERTLGRVPIDLLILALHGPRDRPKLEWYRSIREHQPDLLLIVISEQPDAELEQHCDAVGAAAFLLSPVSLRTLRRCIEQAFDGRRLVDEVRRLERRVAAVEAAAARTAQGPGDETASQVDELWFAILEQLLSRRRRNGAR